MFAKDSLNNCETWKMVTQIGNRDRLSSKLGLCLTPAANMFQRRNFYLEGECFLFPVCNGLFAFLYHVSNSWRCKTSCHLHANWPIKTITRRFSVHRHITLRDQLPVATASNHLPTGWGIHIQKATPMKNIWCLLLPQGNVKQLEKQNRAPMGSKKPESCDSYQAVSVDRDFYIRWLSDRHCKGTFFNKRENSGLTTRLYLRHLLKEQLVM